MISRAAFEAAAVRVAEREGITLDDLRERLRLGSVAARTKPCRTCGKAWTAEREREGPHYCSGACRSRWNRENGTEP